MTSFLLLMMPSFKAPTWQQQNWWHQKATTLSSRWCHCLNGIFFYLPPSWSWLFYPWPWSFFFKGLLIWWLMTPSPTPSSQQIWWLPNRPHRRLMVHPSTGHFSTAATHKQITNYTSTDDSFPSAFEITDSSMPPRSTALLSLTFPVSI